MKLVKIYLTLVCVLFVLSSIIVIVMNVVISNANEIFNPTESYRLVLIFNVFFMGSLLSGVFVYYMIGRCKKKKEEK